MDAGLTRYLPMRLLDIAGNTVVAPDETALLCAGLGDRHEHEANHEPANHDGPLHEIQRGRAEGQHKQADDDAACETGQHDAKTCRPAPCKDAAGRAR